MADWQLLSLEIDEGGQDIGEFFEKRLKQKIKRVSLVDFLEEAEKTMDRVIEIPHNSGEGFIDPPEKMIYTKERIASLMKTFVGDNDKPTLTVYGSGFFHHYTYGLNAAASRLSQKFCYVHFDHHTDCLPGMKLGYKPEGTIRYCNFVEDILEDESTNADDVILVGSYIGGWRKSILYAPFRDYFNSEKALEELAKHLDDTCDDVYVSFDLDVMPPEELITAWDDHDRGLLEKEQLLKMISLIKDKKRIIGADILGYSNSIYGFKSRREYEEMIRKSRELYRDIAEMVMK